MSRKTVLPDALTKGDYFRNRAPSRSPSRRPPRKSQPTNGEANKAFPGVEATKLSLPGREMPRLPHINGSSATSDKGSDKSSNGDILTGEVTLAFIDYRADPSIIKKRPADQMHNVKIIQYIGQGKGASRVNHEFWMQNETAAKFPVTQQSVSSRTPLNFVFYLDGQFFHRLSVCCLNKLRTTHQVIGTKFVHFKVVDVTNIVLCFRCKGHEYMHQSFKKGSASIRSTSLPRRPAADTQLASPDLAAPNVMRVDGSSPPGLKRSRSISKTRSPQVPLLQRPATRTLLRDGGVTEMSNGSAGKKATVAKSNGMAAVQRKRSSDREDMLESYCQDRMSPVSARQETLNGEATVNGEGSEGVDSAKTKLEPEEKIPQNVLDVLGLGWDEATEMVQRYAEPLPSAISQKEAPQNGTETVTVQSSREKVASLPSSRKTSRSRKPSSGIRQPMMSETGRYPLARQDSNTGSLRENSITLGNDEAKLEQSEGRKFSATEVPDEAFGEENSSAVIASTAETVVRDATEGATAQVDDTLVRDAEETAIEVRRGSETAEGTPVDLMDEVAPLMATQPVHADPENPINIDVAEDMIELGGENPVQAESTSRKNSETGSEVRDVTAVSEAIPSLAKEDPVAFAWPDTEGKATSFTPEISKKKQQDSGGFDWPDVTEPSQGKSTLESARTRHVSVEILDGNSAKRSVAKLEGTASGDGDEENTGPLDETVRSSIDRTDTPNSVRDDVPLDEVELKRKKSIEQASTPKGIKRATMGSLRSFDRGSLDRQDHERRMSTPHSAEEFIEQLGYAEEPARPPSVTEEEARPGTATQDTRPPSATSTLPVIGNADADSHIVDHILIIKKSERPKFNHIGSSQDSGANMSDTEKDERDELAGKKPPSSPHNASDMIDQLGFGTS